MKTVLAITLALMAFAPAARAEDEKPYKVENGKVDQATFNGYRRYGLEQFFDFDMISLLKETGSTLGEIRACREMRDPRAYLRLLRRDRAEPF